MKKLLTLLLLFAIFPTVALSFGEIHPTFSTLGEDVVLVEDVTDFPPDVAGVITPEAGQLYLINGSVSMGSNRFDCDGVDLLLQGRSNLHDGLVYTGGGTFITCDAGINIASMFLASTGGKLLVESGSNTENVVFNGVATTGFADLGEIDEIDNFASLLSQWMNFGQGFTFTGTSNTAAFIQTSTFVATSNTGPIFDFDTAVFRTILLEGGRIETFAVGQVGIDGDAGSANVSDQGSIDGVVFAGPGTHVSGITNSDLRWRFQANFGNGGTEDSVNRGAMTMQGNATVTTITTIDTPVKVAGTWTQQSLSRFTFLSNGRLIYVGIPDIRASFTITISPTSGVGGNQDLTCYPAINGAVMADFGSQATVKAGDTTSITMPAESIMANADYLEAWCENNTSTTNIIAVSGKFIVNGF